MEEMLFYKEFLISAGLLLALLILVALLCKKLAYYQNENKSLQEMLVSLLNKYSNRDSILSKYVYDIKSGIYKHKTSGAFYCHKCIIEGTKESALQAQKKGWYCPACGSFYRSPEF